MRAVVAGGGGGDRRRDGDGRRPAARRAAMAVTAAVRSGTTRAAAPDARCPSHPRRCSVEFLPDERCLASIIKQIRSTHMAYPLFGLARMFLQEPARHWVQFTVVPAAAPAGTTLYQLGEDGPVTLDRAVLERIAFDAVEGPILHRADRAEGAAQGQLHQRGARASRAARCSVRRIITAYQPALRALYESRFSRRMSFEDYRRNIEVVSDPALVERWKEEARTATTMSHAKASRRPSLQSRGRGAGAFPAALLRWIAAHRHDVRASTGPSRATCPNRR